MNSCGLIADRVGLQTQPIPSPPTHPWVRKTRQRTVGAPENSEELTGKPSDGLGAQLNPFKLTNFEPQNSEEPFGPLPENLRDPCEPFNAPPPSRLTPKSLLGCRWSESRNA